MKLKLTNIFMHAYMAWLLGVGWGFLLAFLDVFSILAVAPEKNPAIQIDSILLEYLTWDGIMGWSLPGKYCSMTDIEVWKCSTRPTTLYRVSKLYFAIWKHWWVEIKNQDLTVVCHLKSSRVRSVGALKVWPTKVGELHVLASSTYLFLKYENRRPKLNCGIDKFTDFKQGLDNLALTWHSRSPLLTQEAKSFLNHSWGGAVLFLHLFALLR